MKKMSVDLTRKINGGEQHVAYTLYSKKKQAWLKRYKYTWICANCGQKFNTYLYY